MSMNIRSRIRRLEAVAPEQEPQRWARLIVDAHGASDPHTGARFETYALDDADERLAALRASGLNVIIRSIVDPPRRDAR